MYKKINHARDVIISCVSSRSKITDFRGVISPEFSPCKMCFYLIKNNFVMQLSKKIFTLQIDEGRFQGEKIVYF